ncbi:separase isoform X2 [Jatropha curcas]|uniref:separase isoform X2 n=1 Tax=Jatropha curcas TaxID=180498 RepID=UPI0009D673D3|nr:separase isoform X2 [Jatropha curcas]
MASLSESSLISKLESSTSTPISSFFFDYLNPFSDLKNPKKCKPQNKTQVQTQTRSLAKQFLPFLNRSLSVLPKRLSDASKLPSQDSKEIPKFVNELFDIYSLCLDCLEVVSSQLSGKPYMMSVQRLRLVYCLETWGLYKEAENEGFRVLGRLRDLGFEEKKKKEKKSGKLLPSAAENGDLEFAKLVVELVVVIVKCLALGQSMDGRDYMRVIGLVEEVTPWFRVLDANACEKLHRVLVTYLGKCTLFLVGDLTNFDGDVVHAFCVTTLDEYAKSSLKDQIYKYSRRICSSLFLLQDDRPSVVIDTLKCVLDSLACKCKVEGQNWGIEFVELVSYCANKCRTASAIFGSTVAEHLNDLADDFCPVLTPLDMILRLYAIGLTLTDCVIKSKIGDITSSKGAKNESAVSILIADGVRLCNLTPLLGSLRSYFDVGISENCVPGGVEFKGSAGLLCSQLDFHHGTSLGCIQKDRNVYLLGYLNALKFLCQPLAELVNLDKKQIIAEDIVASVSTLLLNIQEAFDQFFDVFLSLHSTASQKEGDDFNEHKIILSISVAAFTLSIRTKHKFQRNVQLIKQIIAAEWIQTQGLKYIFASLYNLGVHLYRNKQENEASKALKLSCTASWSYVTRLCKMFMSKSKGLIGDHSEDAIIDFVTETCTRTAFLLDILYQCGSHKVKKIIVNSLENWSVAEDLFRRLPAPMTLVKQWVKIVCKKNKNLEVDDSAPTLYYLLSSSVKLSKGISKILQQELLAYEEMEIMYPELCQRMQNEIIDIILQNVYVTQDSYLERARILIRKGRALRTHGFEGSEDCVQCLSEAISIINGEKRSLGAPSCHQLAVAYCLRALCIQEAEPTSKQVFQDIKAAINIWLGISISDGSSILTDSVLPLLYNIVDLFSVKGSTEFHHDIYKLIIRLFEQKELPLEKFLPILWESRRLSHALCVSPVSDELLLNLSRDYGEQFKSAGFWMDCLKGFPHSLVGFQQNFSYLFSSVPCGSCNHETSFQLAITVDDVKQAVHELISRVPMTSCSVFFAGNLYYDLSEKLTATGHLFEALYYAKEAHRLRTKLFQEKFTYSVDQQNEKHIEYRDHSQKPTYGLCNLRLNKSIVSEMWYSDSNLSDLDACYLSPWKVLQCYLESTLQVGSIHERLGNGSEAEAFLLWGKGISCQQSLSLFIVAFSSVLGKLYRTKRCWDLSEKEIQNAKQILAHSSSAFSCLKCRLILEVTVDQQLADLFRNRIFDATRIVSMEMLSLAESLYKSSLEKLNLPVWKNPVSCPKEEDGIRNIFACSDVAQPKKLDFASTRSGPNAKGKGRKCRQTKDTARSLLKEQTSATEHNMRLTRSRYRSSKNQNANSFEVQLGLSKQFNENNECDLFNNINQRETFSEMNSGMADFGSEVACICNKMKCWFCLAKDVKDSGSLINFIYMKCELVRRRLFLRLLSGRGKCLDIHGQIHEVHEIILQSISVAVSQNSFTQTYSTVSLTFLLDLVERELCGDVFAIERAALLYNLCWFFLKSYSSKDSRSICCDLSHIQFQKIVSCLKLAFVLSREVPLLFQKVSRLLSVIYVLSSSSELFSLPSCGKVLSESHWASYFHQASLGTHLTYQFFTSITGKHKAERLIANQALLNSGATNKEAETCNSPRLAPKSLQFLEQFVTEFFLNLPCTTVICISLIEGPCATLLQELLKYPSCVHTWMLLSRLNFKNQPIVMLLPLNAILEEASDDDEDFSERNGLDKHWHCPWGVTVIDEVAPAFKLILEENYLSSSIFPLEDTKENRTLWWMTRKKLDCQLGKLLRKLEDIWFGSLRHVLLGELSNHNHLDSVLKKLKCNLKSKCKVDINESFLKVTLGAGRCALDGEVCVSDLLSLRKGCFIGKALYSDGKTHEDNKSEGVRKLPDLAIQLLSEAVNELEEDSVNREPVILVLDSEVQMLPWENLPVLRNQEVYRMPSVGSICLTLDRSCNHQEQIGRIVSAFPVIDPLDAFYLLNPSGDLSSTQVEFENWFRDQNFEGKAGCAPTAEELTLALKSHDLFLYFGHGSGAQYISQQEIQKLKNCAATLLMGCSSGALSLNGSYIPQGTPLSYLLAGSPIIVANLWEVTDKDIDRFGKAMLDAWLKERSSDCSQCNLLTKEFEAMNLKGQKVTTRKKAQTRKESETCDSESLKNCCNHRARIGSFMSQAREACTLPFLIGASPVCYGVPTGIRRKKDL